MNAAQAVEKRIAELCKQRKIAINSLAALSEMSPSTIYSMLNSKSKNPGIVSLSKLCTGLGISLRDFFDCELFDNLDRG